VLMSPAQLALVAAAIGSGTPAAPVEVVGAEPAGPAPEGPGQQVLDALRPMMREVVLSGTAKALAGRGEVYGKTGTAEFGSNTPPDAHGWFMGYRLGGAQGDIAFAVLVEGGQSSSTAVAVTNAFLGAL
jgi:cell division protein FtsI/penicillin-binding protein 2